MEEQASWRGQGFTLLVFGGIVFLCSIFFVLGMLVGRSQGQKFASVAAAEAAAKAAQPMVMKEEKPEMTFYDSVENAQSPSMLEPPPAETVSAAPAPSPASDAGPVINFQIAAVGKSADAQRLLDEVKGKGFRGFILAPAPGDARPFYRVQIGPYSDPVEAEMAKQKLAESGYQPIKK